MEEGMEEARNKKMEQYQQELEEKKKEEKVKGLLRLTLSNEAYERLMNVRIVNPQLYAMATNQVFNLYQKAGRKLNEKEVLGLLKALKGQQKETRITFK
ncbi:MAG: DNA-binding protein [Candidatus Micrarchaeia archaeon]